MIVSSIVIINFDFYRLSIYRGIDHYGFISSWRLILEIFGLRESKSYDYGIISFFYYSEERKKV